METKSGWMEIMDVLNWLNQNHELATRGIHYSIIPTVIIPLTFLTVGLTSLAGMVAGWFGIKLHTEGPKQFLEVLLKKRVLISMVVMNLVFWGVYKSYVFIHNLPSFLVTINYHSNKSAVPSTESYPDSLFRKHDYLGELTPSTLNSLKLEKEIKIDKGAFRSGVISGDSIFYGSDDGYIYEFDKNNLDIKRKFFVGTRVTTSPIIYQNKIYVGEGGHDTHYARIYSFDLTSGKFINAFKTTGHTEGQPLIEKFKNNDMMFVASGRDGLYAVDPNSMKEIWHKKDGHLDATVAVENDVVYIGTGVEKGNSGDRSYAIAYDYLTGRAIWKKELPLSNWMHPVVTDKDVCYVLGEIYVQSSVGLLYCLNKIDGNPHFSIPFDAPLTGKPYYVKDSKNLNEYILLGAINGDACAVDLNKKEKIWCNKTALSDSTYSFSSFSFDPTRSLLWYASAEGGLYGMDLLNGQVLLKEASKKTTDNYSAPTIEGNSLYHMDIKGHLKKYVIN